jgi:hypothetical protein
LAAVGFDLSEMLPHKRRAPDEELVMVEFCAEMRRMRRATPQRRSQRKRRKIV